MHESSSKKGISQLDLKKKKSSFKNKENGPCHGILKIKSEKYINIEINNDKNIS